MNAPFDMTATIAAKSDQLNADDLIGGPLRVTIRGVSAGNAEQPVNVFYEGDGNKPFRPCKTMRRVMVALWGPDASQYVGRELVLYRDPDVMFGGMKVGGIRISHASHIDSEQTVVAMKTKGKREAIKVKPLAARPSPARPSGGQFSQADTGDAPPPSAEPEAAPTEDKAAEWAARFRAEMDICPDGAALEALLMRETRALAKLERDRPELHEGIARLRAALSDQFAAAAVSEQEAF